MKNVLSFIVCWFLILILSYAPPHTTAAQAPATDKGDTITAKKAITDNYVSVLEFKKINDSAEASFEQKALTTTQKQLSSYQSLRRMLYDYMKKKDRVKVVYVDARTGDVIDPTKAKKDIETNGPDVATEIEFEQEQPRESPPTQSPKKESGLKRFFKNIFSIFK